MSLSVALSIAVVAWLVLVFVLSKGMLRRVNTESSVKEIPRKVTQDQVDNWVGNFGDFEERDEFMLETLTEIANGRYSAYNLAREVAEYNEDEEGGQ